MYLFGSWASGTERRASDIDLAIDAPAPLPATLLASLREAIEESHVPYRVDVVDLAEVDPSFRARALREGALDRARERLSIAARALSSLRELAQLPEPTEVNGRQFLRNKRTFTLAHFLSGSSLFWSGRRGSTPRHRSG